MREQDIRDEDLGSGIARIYAGPLEGFVDRRDSAARQLRAAGRRDDAATVKLLRKPTRVAWALNAASGEDPPGIDRVAAAVAAALVAQAGSGDLRSALGEMREAVQKLADTASRAAARREYAVDRGELVNAIMAVIGVPHAFDRLRAGRLTEIPEAGNLDILTVPSTSSALENPTALEPAASRSPRTTASTEALRQAEIALEAARTKSAAAEQALRVSETEAENAEIRLLAAQEDAVARAEARERARAEARTAAAQLIEAERALATVRNAVNRE